MDLRLAQIDKQLEQVDRRFDMVEQRLGQTDQRFDRMELRYGDMVRGIIKGTYGIVAAVIVTGGALIATRL